ncbi:CRISPR-associated ring nuclease Csm6 [Marichromatium bheemlicum]|uniref:TIGR02584 family CRISPR-associated protein n=1 Tax=Marichromatium bheemlicum TaxID=365339 RepID=A0ABX1IAU5_9GAMM|nr:CRISPR-associated ring nuclease Csm6 [Marichromatium bheemlicum]NKN34659.1 TIGR02584 family CRISPR-associated protein [Marichromatium bheemlicum]
MNPRSFPRRVMVAVTGLSPQVVTETLFALAVGAPDPWVPTEVRLITTTAGERQARESLLSEDPGWFHRLVRDYDLPPIRFDTDCLQVLKDAAGVPLSDIRTHADGLAAADQICALVRGLCADAGCALHVSIAGGRKTMGYSVGHALGLFGRPQDRLSHVLISDPFESCREFFYPSPTRRMVATREGMADARDADVSLADIPFLRLRDGLPRRLIDGDTGFGEYIEAAQRALAPPNLLLNIAEGAVYASGERVGMPPAQFAFYLMMAEQRRAGIDGLRWDDDGVAHQFLRVYRRLAVAGDVERAEAALAAGMTKEYFEQRKTLSNAALKDVLGPQLARPYLIVRSGKRPRSRFGLQLDPEAIEIQLPH